MYTLLHGLYKYLMQKDEYFILILGLDNAGKTVRHSQTFRGYNVRIAKYRLFVDLPRGGEDKIHEELQGYESEQDYDHCRLEHW